MKNKETQLNLWGLSLDENHFTSMIWGRLDFVPTASDKWKDTCRHCLLCTSEEELPMNEELDPRNEVENWERNNIFDLKF